MGGVFLIGPAQKKVKGVHGGGKEQEHVPRAHPSEKIEKGMWQGRADKLTKRGNRGWKITCTKGCCLEEELKGRKPREGVW